MYSMFSSSIAAISTPKGSGGIAVIRISGKDSLAIADRFVRLYGKKTVSEMEANTALPCRITDENGDTIDTAVVTVFRAPKSFTGEDTVEISCHGGIIVSGDVLSRALECGAAPAGPGEFTRRAFSAGKLSLSQAEAIGEVISAKSRAALRLSRSNVDGRLAKGIDEIYTDIKTALSAVYAETDFPDEGLSPVSPDEMRMAIVNVKAKLEALKNSYKAGHAVVEGIQTVLCGKPNTGKSTLLNLLCEAERAIVTDIAGTTRDIITEQVTCGDATLLISDTAGIRDTDDKIEAVGVDRALEKLDGAELIIAVFDASKPLDEDDIRVISAVKGQHASGAVTLAVLNKTDLGTAVSENELTDAFDETVIISAKDNSSREKIADVINALFIEGSIGTGENAIITNARQYAKVCQAYENVSDALSALDIFGTEIAGTELESAMGALGELDGMRVGIEIVDDIFSKFCVGK